MTGLRAATVDAEQAVDAMASEATHATARERLAALFELAKLVRMRMDELAEEAEKEGG